MTSIMLSVVIPAYNEDENLGAVIDDALRILTREDTVQPFEIIVVNDGSSDRTGCVAEEYRQTTSSIRVLHHASNQGLGVALRTGFANSQGEYVGWLPADGQVRADQIINLLRIADGADFITTTRLGAVEQQNQRRSLLRKHMTWWMHILCKICLGIYPTHFTGTYMARGPYLRSIPLNARTCLVGMELYVKSLRRNAKLQHGECVITHRLSGKSKVATSGGILMSVLDMLRMGYSRLTGLE
jgi:glycosyltransferase involved in cell wall biosynthesis